MDYRNVQIGKWHKVDRIDISDPSPRSREPDSYRDCHVLFADGWCYIEVRDDDGENSVNVVPASRIQIAINVHEEDVRESDVPQVF